MENRVGIIGLGLLGQAIAERLRVRGWKIRGYDIDADRRSRASQAGVEVLGSGKQVAERETRILLSLPSGDAVAGVLAAIGPSLQPGTLIIDTTTAEPDETVRFAAAVGASGGEYVDATVAGSSAQARAGEVMVMAGGKESSVVRAEPVLRIFAASVLHVGDHGAGSRFKLVHNLMLGLSRAALAESLALGRALGLEDSKVLNILKASPAAYSRVMDTKGEKMIRGDFSTQATVRQHLKDVRLMLAAAAQEDIELPLSRVHEHLLQTLVDRGLSEQDNSAIIRAYEPE